MARIEVIITDDGFSALHSDELARALATLSVQDVQLQRASHVEPVQRPDGSWGWGVDMSPSGLPSPEEIFNDRSTALQRERELWLQGELRRAAPAASDSE